MPVHWAARAEAAKENGGDESDEQQGPNNGANDGATSRRMAAAVATVDAVAVGAALLVVATVEICGTRASARRAQTFPRAGAARFSQRQSEVEEQLEQLL